MIQQLLTVANTVQEALTANKGVDVIYLDFKKAFDSVLHNKLLSKLWSLGIRGNLWNWFKAYLGSRQQCVHINDSLSSMVPILSGVPQGSILGPLLFADFINDLPLHVTLALLSLFADDPNVLRLYQILPTLSNPTDIISLQNALNQAFNWSNTNDLFFNESKFLHIHFGKDFGSHNFTINGTPIVRSNCVKDLGVHISSFLKSSTHCEFIASNAYKSLGLIRRTFSTHSTIAKKLLYLTLVRSRLTYCSQLWRPYLLKDISLLERVQRRATKYILNDYHSPYKSRLIQLDLLPLMYQYELSDLLFFIKSYKTPYPHFDINNYISMKASVSTTRSSSSGKLVHRISTTNSNRHFLFLQTTKIMELFTLD